MECAGRGSDARGSSSLAAAYDIDLPNLYRAFDTCGMWLLVSKIGRTISRHNSRPRRLARPRTSPFHGGNTGSNPVGDANK
jgi:hypothetical protein